MFHHQMSLNAWLCHIHPAGKMSVVLLLHDIARPHTSMHTIEAISDIGLTMLLPAVYSHDHTLYQIITCSVFRRKEKKLWIHHYCRMPCVSDCRGQRATFTWVWMPAVVGSWKKKGSKDGHYNEKQICLPAMLWWSSLKFTMCPTCK